MKKKDELIREITEMIKETKAGKINWEVRVQTTEYNPNEKKPTVMEENGTVWVVDECYVSYFCTFKGKEFFLITYEMLHSCMDKQKSTNMVFLPPLGIRYFDIHTLLPYAVEADQMLTYQIHMLWLMLLELQKTQPQRVDFDATERELSIDEDRYGMEADEDSAGSKGNITE